MEFTDYVSELSKCVRCGSCKAYCPTYDEGLTEAMGARGRLTLLRGMLTRQIEPSPLLRDRIFSCMLCGACESLCPPHVHVTETIYHARRLLQPSDHRLRYLGMLMRFSAGRPMLSFRIAKVLQQLGIAPWKILDRLSAPYRWALARKGAPSKYGGALPFAITLPHRPLRDDQQVYKPEKKIGRVALFTGCSTNFLFPRLGMSLINVLLRLGYEVVLPQGEVCCGAPFRSLGFEDDAAELARKNQKVFGKLNAEAVLSLCPTCIVSLKVHYPKLLGNAFDHVTDVSSFLLHRLGSLQLFPVQDFRTVTYHDPCHLSYVLGVKREPRELIRLTGVELRDAEGDGCCGFGGPFSFQYRDISRSLLQKRVDAYGKTGADALITSCPGCMLQLGAGMRDRPILHIIELVERTLGRKHGRERRTLP